MRRGEAGKLLRQQAQRADVLGEQFFHIGLVADRRRAPDEHTVPQRPYLNPAQQQSEGFGPGAPSAASRRRVRDSPASGIVGAAAGSVKPGTRSGAKGSSPCNGRLRACSSTRARSRLPASSGCPGPCRATEPSSAARIGVGSRTSCQLTGLAQTAIMINTARSGSERSSRPGRLARSSAASPLSLCAAGIGASIPPAPSGDTLGMRGLDRRRIRPYSRKPRVVHRSPAPFRLGQSACCAARLVAARPLTRLASVCCRGCWAQPRAAGDTKTKHAVGLRGC